MSQNASIVPQLLSKYSIISEQVSIDELQIILKQLEALLADGVEGDIVEFGCYTGTTSLFLQRLLLESDSSKQLHVYDSFAGLPDKLAQDQSAAGHQFVTGELFAKKSQFIMNFKKSNLPLPVIHKGWFKDLTSNDIPDQIALAFLDGDYYESIHDSLRLVWPRLASGAVVIVDDYYNEALPGAKKAFDEFIKQYAANSRIKIINSLALVVNSGS